MAIEAPTPDAAIAGLDQLEVVEAAPARRRIPEKVWAAAWPKLLAVVLALAIWQLVYLSGFKHAILPGPATTLPNLWSQAQHAELWHAIGTSLRRGPKLQGKTRLAWRIRPIQVCNVIPEHHSTTTDSLARFGGCAVVAH